MKTKILIVDDTFLIQGRGLVICGLKTGEFVDFKVGDSVEIQTSEEVFLQNKITGIELIHRSPDAAQLICFSVSEHLKKNDVPRGAAIWLLSKED